MYGISLIHPVQVADPPVAVCVHFLLTFELLSGEGFPYLI